MKIERISETQVKFLITAQDLKEKDVTLSEILTQSTAQSREFFRDILKEAVSGFGVDIDIENCPIIMEAMPISDESIIIIVSKARDSHDFNEQDSLIPKSLTQRKFKLDDEIKIIEQKDNYVDKETVFYVYSFENFEQVSNATLRIKHFEGDSILYKMGSDYFLALEKTDICDEKLEIILSEYGQKYNSSVISKYFLEEHGEVLIKQKAVEILTSI